MTSSQPTRFLSPELGDLRISLSPVLEKQMARTKQASRHSTGGQASRLLRSTPRAPSSTSSLTAKAGLLTIPVELQTSIVSYLTSIRDLKRANLVCKEIQAIATPLLYRTVTLTLCQINDRLKRSFNTANKGLAHIRTLTIVEPHGSYRHSRHGPPLSHLLHSLPKDGLTAFSLCTSGIVSNDVAIAVRLRQRRLTNFLLNHVKAPPLADFLPDAEELRNVTSLAFYLGSKHDANRGAVVLQAASNVRNLALAVPRGNYCDDALCRSLFEGFLSPWLLNSNNARIQLRSIKLERFDVKLVAPILATVLDPGSLSEVTLVRCHNTHRLMEVLSQLRPNLKSFIDDRAYHDTRERGMLEELLKSFSGLERLRLSTEIYSEIKNDCDWAAIERHSATLRTLHLDDFKSENKPFAVEGKRSMAGFQDLLRQCCCLRELAVRTPSPEYGWRAFNFAFGPFVDALKGLPDLRTLRLFFYLDTLEPTNIDSGDDSEDMDMACTLACELREAAAKSQVQNVANKVFDALHASCPHFVALVVEPRPPNISHSLDDSGERYAFTRVLKKDLYGRIAAGAEECDLSTIKFHEPCCDILSDDLQIMSAA